MLPVTCYVADFNLRPGFFPLISSLAVNGRVIDDYLQQASGPAAIDVTLDYSRRGLLPEFLGPLGVSTDQMMEGLGRLLAGVPSSGKTSMGLLIADACAEAPDQFGLMFDLEGDGGGLGPRQGCAVFLTAIATALGVEPTDPSARDFISFIALHEIGHAFNLWHVNDNSIMQAHPRAGDLGSMQFEDTQKHFLSLAGGSGTSRCVLPGVGCSAYGTRPPGFPSGDSQPFSGPVRGHKKLDLHIALSTESLWHFEPIELDVTLSVTKKDGKAVLVPNEIDPAYASFQIWITRPDGVRIRYRPMARFCRRNGTLRITPDAPFARDIAIGRQAGGYTFAIPGRHQVQAAFAVKADEFILSNVVTCEVKPPLPSSAEWVAARIALDNAEARHFLQYKRRVPSLQTYARLEDYASSGAASPHTAAAIRFAVGRALVKGASSHAGTPDRDLLALGRQHLDHALQLEGLSTKRRRDAQELRQA